MAIPMMAVLFVLLVIAVFLFYRSKIENKIKEPTYQFFLTVKKDFSEPIKLIAGDDHGTIHSDGVEHDVDPSPIYYTEKRGFILPMDMCYMDVGESTEWRVEANAQIFLSEENEALLQREEKKTYLNGGFFHDGGRSYVFLDEVTIHVDGTDYELTPMSFVSKEAGIFRIYCYGDEELIVPTSAGNVIEVTGKRGYRIDLLSHVYYPIDGGRRLLVASPKVLVDMY